MRKGEIMLEHDNLQHTHTHLDSILKFVDQGELPSGISADPKENEEAILDLSEHFIRVLTNDRIADIVLSDDDYRMKVDDEGLSSRVIWEERFKRWEGKVRVASTSDYWMSNHKSLAIALVRPKNGEANVQFTFKERSDRGEGYPVSDEQYIEFKKDLHAFYPSEDHNSWKFSQKMRESRNHLNPEKRVLITGERSLQPSDLAQDQKLFLGFMSGRRWPLSNPGALSLFREINGALNRMANETHELKSVIGAARIASQLLMF